MTDAQVSKIVVTIFVVGAYIASAIQCGAVIPGRHVDDLTTEIHALRVEVAAFRECPTEETK
jgi:hypothetical protein